MPATRWIWTRPVSEDHPLVVRLRAERPGLWEALPTEPDAALRDRFSLTPAELADLRARLGVSGPEPAGAGPAVRAARADPKLPTERPAAPRVRARAALASGWVGAWPDRLVAARFGLADDQVRHLRELSGAPPCPPLGREELRARIDEHHPGLLDRLAGSDQGLRLPFRFLELLRELFDLGRSRPTTAECEAAWRGARTGLSWREVAGRVGLRSATVAREAARTWARDQQLPWPPPRSQGPAPRSGGHRAPSDGRPPSGPGRRRDP